MSTAAADRRPRRERRNKGKRWVGWLIAAVLLIAVAAIAWAGVRGILAANELRRALPVANTIQTDIMNGDAAAATSAASGLRQRADKAHALTSDPVYRVVEKTPWLGPNLRALSGLSASAASVTGNGLDPLTRLAGELNADSFKPQNGALNVAPLATAAPTLAKADTAVQAGARAAHAVSTKGVVAPLATAVDQYTTKIDQVAAFTGAASRAATLLPGMLGQDSPRTYLLLVLNNAELRASGGIPGSVIHVTADHGSISFDSQYSGSSFGPYDQPIAPLAAPTNELFTQITGEYMQDVTLTPHFDQSAKLAMAMWQQRFGQSVDGVVSLDPVALKYILQATGPVTVAAGTPQQTELTSQNVVKALLSDVYARFSDPNAQDAFFDVASGAIFSKLTAGQFEPAAMLTAFAHIGDERRMRVWSAKPEEEKQLVQTTLAGGPPKSAAGEQRFGVYLADGTGSKMDYYLHTSVTTGQLTCSNVGPLYVVEITLKNGVAPDQVASLPEYVSGGGSFGVPVGTMRTQVTVYGSPDVEFGNAFDGKGGAEPVKFVKDGDRSVAQYVVDVKAGESSTVRLVYNPKKGKTGKPAVDVTPQINPVSVSRGKFECGTVLK
ncbi:DUF4012 domain-containing protein [Gryllotalpicola protaetiae]|nr:DUF4012 domain-containing protein [Gryllotalpicola protaetiae]